MGTNFSWVEYWGTTNDKEVAKNIVVDAELTASKPVKLITQSIYVGKNEAGGGMITFKEGKFVWMHQADQRNEMNVNNLRLLEYTKKWVDLSILSEDLLNKQVAEFNLGEDPCPEHYRWRAFSDFLIKQGTVTDEQVCLLMDLVKTDNDKSMASAMGLAILQHKHLTDDQFEVVSSEIKTTFGEHMEKSITKAKTMRAII